jgi:regulatory protein
MTEKSVNDIINDLVPADEVDRFADPKKARKKAMDLLARREHSRDELCRKLEKAGFDAEIAFDAIARLGDEGLQSDERFVESFVQSRINQGKGPARIRAELGQKGVVDAIIDRALETSGADWYALAGEIRAGKFGTELPSEFKEKARQMRFLQYRGFESDHIQSAVSSYDE